MRLELTKRETSLALNAVIISDVFKLSLRLLCFLSFTNISLSSSLRNFSDLPVIYPLS